MFFFQMRINIICSNGLLHISLIYDENNNILKSWFLDWYFSEISVEYLSYKQSERLISGWIF